jgi:hypothetical protein
LQIPRIHRILLIFHPRLFEICKTTHQLNQKGNHLAMEDKGTTSVRILMRQDVFKTHFATTRFQPQILCPYRCISIQSRSHSITRKYRSNDKETKAASHHILLNNIHPYQMKLQCIRTRTPSNHQGTGSLESLPQNDC